jgi:proline iminopeptidase
MYYELHGNPKGRPVVILHGGPGGGIMHKHLDNFDLRKWNIIMFDQRGCGKSTPFGLESLEHNKTEYLVEDIECLREHLNISQWYVFGGSWGTILGILYAKSYPENVSGLLLRSICTLEPSEYEWLYEQKGAGQLYPKEWAEFISVINGPYTYKSIIANYRKLLTSKDSLVRQKAVNHWSDWENAVSFLLPKKPEKSYKNISGYSSVSHFQTYLTYGSLL